MSGQDVSREKVGRAEGRRRAAILRRYVAIPRPTADDDVAFAAELGLSTDSLVRLAAAWRRHGDTLRLQGSRYLPTQADRHAALEALRGEVDLGEVPESRRGELRRRLDAIRRFLEADEFDTEAWAAAAAKLGITARQFAKIVHAWTIHRSPAAVPGARAAKRPRRKSTAAFDSIQERVRQALDELGSKARGADVHRRVVELSEQAGVAPPSRTTVHEHLQRLRG